MLKNKKGYSLTVLVIAIAVILIITTAAIISIKNIGKDKEISKFMSDLQEVKQYVIEYFAKNNTLPVVFEGGEMKSAESELIQILSSGDALFQLDEDDVGEYYYVDIGKLGKIHLSDKDRGYIINEGTLNVYVTKPCEYQGTKYYTLTPFLLGEKVDPNAAVPFQINILGNPITWTDKADILISIPNVKIGEAEGWNFKWLKGSKSAADFKEIEGTGNIVNYFVYGDVITFTENGIYTIYVENPEKVGIVRKVVVSKIDDIPPTIRYVSGELYLDDGQTGISKIRCKIKENSNFPISQSTREKFPEYYTMSDEVFNDTELLEKYLWGDENIKGDTVEDYFKKYESYYAEYTRYNAILLNPDSGSGEKENAIDAITHLNEMNPQFAYEDKRFSDVERNIAIYVEDMVGNGTVYSAVSRNDLLNMQYVSSDALTLVDSKIVINNNKAYTNTQNVSLYLQSIYAKYLFITEVRGEDPTWKNFNESVINYRLTSGDGEKIVYVFFKDNVGKTQGVYDKIFFDGTKPTDTAPVVSGDANSLSIIAKQTDSIIVDGVETQSGIANISYGVREEDTENYIWYSKVSLIPKLRTGVTYYIATKATDKAGNEQISKSVSFRFTDETLGGTLEIGDYVEYAGDSTNSYTLSSALTGYNDEDGTVLTPKKRAWRVWDKKADGSVVITPMDAVNSFYLSGATGFSNSVEVIEAVCDLYTNSSLGITANDVRSMKIEDLEDTRVSSNMITVRDSYINDYGVAYGQTNAEKWGDSGYKSGNFYTESDGVTIRKTPNVASSTNPIVLKQTTYYNDSPAWNNLENSKFSSDTYGTLLGNDYVWLASPCVDLRKSHVYFRVFCARSNAISYEKLYDSDDVVNGNNYDVRPLVTLGSTLQVDKTDTTRDGSTADKAWKIIKK